MNSSFVRLVAFEFKKAFSAMRLVIALVGLDLLRSAASALHLEPDGVSNHVCGYLGSINNVLNITSIVVVAAAIIFCGYKVAIKRFRIADVAPVLIGGLLIGAAAQMANMLVDRDTCVAATHITTSVS